MDTVVALKTASFHTGMVHSSRQNHSVTVVVLPKSWKPIHLSGTSKYSYRTYVWPAAQREGVLCLYENEHIDLFLTDPQFNAERDDDTVAIRRALLNDLMQASNDSRNDLDDKDTNLISWGIPSRKTSRSENFFSSDLETAMPNIIALYMLLNISGYSQSFERRFDKLHHNLLLPLLHLRFMQEILNKHRMLNKEYILKSEILPTIRGRVSALSLAKSEETEERSVLCHYDELDTGTPIVRVLLTALDIVSRGHALSKNNDDSSQEYLHIGNTAKRGVQIRRFFQSIPSYPLHKALHVSLNIRTTQKNAYLQPLLSMARLILQRKQASLKQINTQEHSMWCWEVDMSDVWEFILFKGYQTLPSVRVMYYDKSTGDCSIYPKQSIPAAFGNGQKNQSVPDLLLTTTENGSDQSNWIVDAKYSYCHNHLPASANIEYRDQMFRYLFLTSQEQAESQSENVNHQLAKTPWAHHLALVYTTGQLSPLRDSGQSVQSIWLDSWGKTRPKLYQFAVKFPAPADVQSVDVWKHYSRLLATQLQQTLDLSS